MTLITPAMASEPYVVAAPELETSILSMALIGIKLMFSIFPAILAILSAVSIFFYRLDGDKVEQIERELAKRH